MRLRIGCDQVELTSTQPRFILLEVLQLTFSILASRSPAEAMSRLSGVTRSSCAGGWDKGYNVG
jgi:hypothetical protein